MRRIRSAIPALLICVILTTSCGKFILVVDNNGHPIPSAVVMRLYPSFNGNVMTTSAKGLVSLPITVWNADAIRVSKEGYAPAIIPPVRTRIQTVILEPVISRTNGNTGL